MSQFYCASTLLSCTYGSAKIRRMFPAIASSNTDSCICSLYNLNVEKTKSKKGYTLYKKFRRCVPEAMFI